jgi:hypothetical protein
MILTTLSLAGCTSIPLEFRVSQCPLSYKPACSNRKEKAEQKKHNIKAPE